MRATGETVPAIETPMTELSHQHTDVGILQPTVILDEKTGREKPNLQIQITHHGDRAVSHTPDTTGTPATTPNLTIPPYISAAPTNPALIHVDPDLLLEYVLQRKQQQKETATVTIEQKPTLPIKDRLGPMTPPPPYTEVNVKTENGPGSRCVEIRPHGLKDRPRPRDNRTDAAQIGERIVLDCTRRTIPTYTGNRSDPTLLQRSHHTPGGHQKRICKSATLYGENNVMCVSIFTALKKFSCFSHSFLISSDYYFTLLCKKFISILLIRILRNVKDPYQASPMCLNHIITLKGGVVLV